MHNRFGSIPFGMMGGWNWILPTILIVIIGIAVYMIFKNKKESNYTKSNSALDILDERYAKGEIDEEEYNKRKKNIRDSK